jgi:hypothetical protein
VVSSTTSTQDSGLFASILPIFKATSGIAEALSDPAPRRHATASRRECCSATLGQLDATT